MTPSAAIAPPDFPEAGSFPPAGIWPEGNWLSDEPPMEVEFVGLHLVSGQYEPITPTEQGWLWSQQLQLFLGVEGERLRWLTPEGVLVPTPQEAAHQAQQRAEQLAAKLRELGIDPDTVA